MPQAAHADEARGRELVAEALRARDAGDHLYAERLLRTSLEEFPWTFSAFTLAQELVLLKQDADALTTLEALKDGAYGSLDGDALAAVEKLYSQVVRQAPRLRLRLLPSVGGAALVDVDGVERRTSFTESGVLDLPLNVGLRRVRVVVTGYEPAVVQVDARRSMPEERSIQLTSAATGRLMILVEDPSVVLVNGAVQPEPSNIRLPVGRYELEVRSPDQSETITVDVHQDATLELDFRYARKRRILGLSIGAAAVVAIAGSVVLGVLLRPQSVPLDRTGT